MVSCFIGKIIPATKAPFDFLNPFFCRLGPVVIQTHDTMVVGVSNRVPPDGFASRIDKPVHVVRVMWVCSKLHVFQPTSHKALGIAVLRTITLYPCIQRHRLREANRQWSVIIASQSVVRIGTPESYCLSCASTRQSNTSSSGATHGIYRIISIHPHRSIPRQKISNNFYKHYDLSR